MQYLMIHEWLPEYEQLDLSPYVLTFDDALYSQYEAIDFLQERYPDNQKIFFVSTGIIHHDCNTPQYKDISCSAAHQLFFEQGLTHNYMSWPQLLKINCLPNCSIQLHGHLHLPADMRLLSLRLKTKIDLIKFVSILKQDFEKALELYQFYFKRLPSMMCMPYNIHNDLITIAFKHLVKDIEIIGKNRIDINALLNIEGINNKKQNFIT